LSRARALGVAGIALAGCDPSPPTAAVAADAGASPNAKILPAPLVAEPPDLFDAGEAGGPSLADSPARTFLDAAVPVPEAMLPATAIPPEPVPYTRDAPGVTVDAVFRWRDLPPPPRAPEVSTDGLREAHRLTLHTLRVDLAEAGRMRAEITGIAFPLAAHTELRARTDRYGNLVVWPNGAGYRVIPPGALRTVIGERRMDVTSLTPGLPRPQGEGRRLGVPVRKIEMASSVATLRFELGRVPESGEGGALLCRALVELGGIDPHTGVCQAGEVPLFASYAWQEGGGVTYEATAVARRPDLSAAALLVPPPSVPLLASGLPGVPRGIFLSREALAALRTAPLPLPVPRDPQVPGEGFVAVNQSDRLMYLLLDGVPVLWVPAHGEQYVIGPYRGRYLAQWRTFLGEKVAPPQPVEMPARLVHGGAADAGAPPAEGAGPGPRPDGG
jgi:hypothetical protein